VPALLMVMPYTGIQFTVLHKLKTFASGSSKTGILFSYSVSLFFLVELEITVDLTSKEIIIKANKLTIYDSLC